MANKALIGAAALVLAAAVSGPAIAARPAVPRAPLIVAETSLAQAGQQVVWTLETERPFSPAALQRTGRRLCLLLERPRTATVAAQLCVTGPAKPSHPPRLEYMTVTAKGPGPAHVIAADVTFSNARELVATFAPGEAGLASGPLRWQVISTLRTRGCVRTHRDRNGCVVLFPRSPARLDLHTPQLVGCAVTGPSLVYAATTHRRVIALTFDDGPSPYTPQLLALLERERVPATFFEIGDQIALYGHGGTIERRMLSDGDMIGDHTWDHRDVSAGGLFAERELRRAAAAIRAATGGFTPCLFRPPYGDVGPGLISLARSLGFTTVNWNVDPRDWSRPGVAAIADNVIANARPGAIVIQHDGGGDRSETVAAVQIEIAALESEGYRFETVTDLLGYRLIYK